MQEWVEALDALEADVAQIERLLADGQALREDLTVEPYVPPQGLGALPPELRPRADAILARQLAAGRAIARALAANRKQATAAARVEAGSPGASRPIFVDRAM